MRNVDVRVRRPVTCVEPTIDGRFQFIHGITLRPKSVSSTAGVGPLLTAAPMAGRITAAPDANGRGTVILATSAGVPRFAFYVVSEKSLLLNRD
jgi:hypothetical protein